jgi:predicted Zn-dependent protease
MWMQGLVVATAVVTSDSNYGNMALAGAGAAAQLATMKYGRSAELESDKYGMRYMVKAGYDPQGAVKLQQTFMRLSEGQNQDWISGLFSSHPPSEERVQENIKTAAKLPPGGVTGVDSYRAAMAQTLAAKPAYDAYDEGRKALADEDHDKALSLANTALDLFSAEANFHALRGDVRLLEDKYDMAVTNYNRAINRRGDFFYYHLQRGIANKELGQSDAAVVDLERSIALLPTAPAHYILGEIAANRGDTTKAIEHYRVVANSGGEIGNAAAAELVRLDLPSNPGAYVASACGDDGSGEVVISVRNDTPVALAGIEVVVAFVDSGGNQRRIGQIFSGQVEPGKIQSVATGIVPAPDSTCTAEVTSARIVD